MTQVITHKTTNKTFKRKYFFDKTDKLATIQSGDLNLHIYKTGLRIKMRKGGEVILNGHQSQVLFQEMKWFKDKVDSVNELENEL